MTTTGLHPAVAKALNRALADPEGVSRTQQSMRVMADPIRRAMTGDVVRAVGFDGVEELFVVRGHGALYRLTPATTSQTPEQLARVFRRLDVLHGPALEREQEQPYD